MSTAIGRERRLFEKLLELRTRVYANAQELDERWRPYLRRTRFTYSAFNLACYLALRRRNLRQLQRQLVPLGLSSLGRCESHVLASLDAVITALSAMRQAPELKHIERPSLKHFVRGRSIIEREVARLLGDPAAHHRHVRIMVTLPPEAAQDSGWVRDVLRRGADCVRIN